MLFVVLSPIALWPHGYWRSASSHWLYGLPFVSVDVGDAPLTGSVDFDWTKFVLNILIVLTVARLLTFAFSSTRSRWMLSISVLFIYSIMFAWSRHLIWIIVEQVQEGKG